MAKKNAEARELEKLQSENTRLKAENARLERLITMKQKSETGHKLQPMQVLRRLGVFALITIAVAMLVAGNLLFWVGNTIVKPDRFTAATAPIIKDTKVQHAMAGYTTNSIFQAVDVQKITEQALPSRADFLAPQLAAQLKSTTEKTLQATLAKPAFQEKWNNILATQHQRLVNLAANHNGDGTVSINDVYNQLEASLQNSKLSFLANKNLPPKVGNITVVNASWLPAFHNVVTNIDTWRLLSVIFFVACAAAAVWLSRNRRKTVYTLSVAVSIFMLVSLIAIRLVREMIVQKVDASYAEGVRSALQIFFHPLVLQTVTIFFAFILAAFVAWVSSPARSAATLRDKIGLVFSGKLHQRLFGDSATGYVAWVGKNKHLLEWGVVGIITALMLLIRLTLKSLIIYALLMLASVLAIEVVAGRPSVTAYKLKDTN
jgi:hypothetical protein